MYLSLKNHPFAVEAYFEQSLVLTFALPKERLQPQLPECLLPDTFDDHWAFVAVALVQTKQLRPKGFPGWVGNDFFLAGYRIFVRYTNAAGKRLRGLYILRSETDRRKMAFFGNLFTHYQYRTTDISREEQGGQTAFHSLRSGLDILIEAAAPGIVPPLPEGSPFKDWKEARRYAGPLPFTFTYNRRRREVLLIEGVREHWQPEPVQVRHYEVGFLKDMGWQDAVLANAFMVRDIPYCWKKGKKELWQPS